MLAGLEPVNGAAIRAASLARVGHVQKDARVAVPQLHAGLRAGAEDAAVAVEVTGLEFNDHALGNQQIQAMFTNRLTLLRQSDAFLPLERDVPAAQLDAERFLIDG